MYYICITQNFNSDKFMFKTKHLAFIIASILILSACGNKTLPSGNNNTNPTDTTKKDTSKLVNPVSWVHSVHITLGVPFDKDTSDDFIIIRNQYVISYNKSTNLCNWVAWELNGDWFGSVSRYGGNFITDTGLPDNFYHVKQIVLQMKILVFNLF